MARKDPLNPGERSTIQQRTEDESKQPGTRGEVAPCAVPDEHGIEGVHDAHLAQDPSDGRHDTARMGDRPSILNAPWHMGTSMGRALTRDAYAR